MDGMGTYTHTHAHTPGSSNCEPTWFDMTKASAQSRSQCIWYCSLTQAEFQCKRCVCRANPNNSKEPSEAGDKETDHCAPSSLCFGFQYREQIRLRRADKMENKSLHNY